MKRKLSNASPGAYPKKRRTDKQHAAASRSSKLAKIGAELKYNDLTLNTDASTTSTEVPMTTIGTGTTGILRDGLKVLLRSVEYRINMANKALTQGNTVRVVLVLDKLAQAEQCTWGAGASVAEVYDAATTVARRNILSASRFVILSDETVVLNQDSGTGGAFAQCYLHRYIKIPAKYQLAVWSGSSATIPVSNALTLMYLGSTAAGATAVTVNGTARLRFNV